MRVGVGVGASVSATMRPVGVGEVDATATVRLGRRADQVGGGEPDQQVEHQVGVDAAGGHLVGALQRLRG